MTTLNFNQGQLTAQMLWTFHATPREMLLILKGLGDRLKDEELEEAQALCDRLTRERVNQVKNLLLSNEKLERNLEGKA